MPCRTCGGLARKGWVTESVTENKPPRGLGRRKPFLSVEVRVKRRGKSPPPYGQPAGQDKPHVVQDRTGDERRLARSALAGPFPGISRTLLRQGFRFGGMREMAVARVLRNCRTEFGLSPPATRFNSEIQRRTSCSLQILPWPAWFPLLVAYKHNESAGRLCQENVKLGVNT